MSEILDIVAREILDSRGNPTVEVDVYLSTGDMGRAVVPSGASTGVGEAVENVNTKIAPNLVGMDVMDQVSIDRLLLYATGVGDEGGFAPNFKSNVEPFEFIVQAIEKAGYKPGEDIAIDVAASSFFKDGKHIMASEKDPERSTKDMIDFYVDLVSKFPIVSIEDGLNENDWKGWKLLRDRLGKKNQIVDDDLSVTSKFLTKVTQLILNAKKENPMGNNRKIKRRSNPEDKKNNIGNNGISQQPPKKDWLTILLIVINCILGIVSILRVILQIIGPQ